MSVSKRERRYIEMAIDIASSSDNSKFRHGAILVKNGKPRNSAHNEERYCAFGNRFRERDCGHATLHAELGCVLGIDRGITQGSTVFVARVNKQGEARMSKPCTMCQAALSHVGVKKVFYTTSYHSIESINL
jgi:tRNA(Arg) A34 adenosine deaminase TadA